MTSARVLVPVTGVRSGAVGLEFGSWPDVPESVILVGPLLPAAARSGRPVPETSPRTACRTASSRDGIPRLVSTVTRHDRAARLAWRHAGHSAGKQCRENYVAPLVACLICRG